MPGLFGPSTPRDARLGSCAMPAERNLPSPEAEEIVGLARDVAQERLAPRVPAAEEDAAFPRDVFRTLGELGFLGMPYPEEVGGAGQPYEVYLQALEEIAAVWASVGVGLSVHVMSCYPLATFGSAGQRERWLGEMTAGELLGGYALSEAEAGSDPGAMRTRAVSGEDGYRVSGSKAWATHGGEADFYPLFARTSADRSGGISCFLAPGEAPGLTVATPERKMGLTGSTTAPPDPGGGAPPGGPRRPDPGARVWQPPLPALDSGRLGIAAVATGLAQGSLDAAVAYAKERETFGRPIIDHQGLGFLLADMAAAVESARAVTLEAARRRDRGLPFSRQASI